MVPSQQPRKPIGIVTRPGNVSGDGEPCESGPGPDRRAEHDHDHRGDDAERDAGQRARRVEAPPEQRQQQRREVRAGGEHERHAHEHGDVEAGADRERAEDRGHADADRGDPGDLALALLAAAPEHVAPQVVGDRARARRSRGPATTARIVANAAAENSARAMSPPVGALAAAERTARAAARRGCRPCRRPRSRPAPSSARAPKPMIVTIAVNDAMMPIV